MGRRWRRPLLRVLCAPLPNKDPSRCSRECICWRIETASFSFSRDRSIAIDKPFSFKRNLQLAVGFVLTWEENIPRQMHVLKYSAPAGGAVSSAVERLVYTELVVGSIPSLPILLFPIPTSTYSGWHLDDYRGNARAEIESPILPRRLTQPPTVNNSADNSSSDCTYDQNWCICFGNERIREAKEQAKDESDHPAGPRKLNAWNGQANGEATRERCEQSGRLIGERHGQHDTRGNGTKGQTGDKTLTEPRHFPFPAVPIIRSNFLPDPSPSQTFQTQIPLCSRPRRRLRSVIELASPEDHERSS